MPDIYPFIIELDVRLASQNMVDGNKTQNNNFNHYYIRSKKISLNNSEFRFLTQKPEERQYWQNNEKHCGLMHKMVSYVIFWYSIYIKVKFCSCLFSFDVIKSV